MATLLSGVMSDRWFPNHVDVSCLIFSAMAVPALFVLLLSPSSIANVNMVTNPTISYGNIFGMGLPELRVCGCMFLLGASISGPKTLIGLAIRDTVPPSATGMAVGVLGLSGQLGLTLAGSGIAIIIERYKWNYYLHYLVGAATLSTCIFAALVLFQKDTGRIKDH